MLQPFSRYHFQGQHENEEVLRIIHRHWFNIAIHYFGITILSGIVCVLLITLPSFFPGGVAGLPPVFLAFTLNTFLLFIWLYVFLVWIDYYFDVWIITNERVVNIEQKGLFNREVSELQFARIQDVTTVVEGLMQTFLNFGDVYVQTAAETERFVFRQVPDPYTIKDMVMQLSRSNSEEDLRRLSEALTIGTSVHTTPS